MWQATFYKNGNFFTSTGETITASFTSTGTGATEDDAQGNAYNGINNSRIAFLAKLETKIYPATIVRQIATLNYECAELK
uniref:Uncharacterized protein n=1 Tax=viral metagenome TaxID=1070528 RepID=A0A6C0BAJ6_9ZZZZ